MFPCGGVDGCREAAIRTRLPSIYGYSSAHLARTASHTRTARTTSPVPLFGCNPDDRAGEPDAVAACAAACSLDEDDEISIAAWLDALAARLTHRIEETDSWETGSWP